MDLNDDGNDIFITQNILKNIWIGHLTEIQLSMLEKTFADIEAENGRIPPAITLGHIFEIFLTMNRYKCVKKMRVLHVKKEIV